MITILFVFKGPSCLCLFNLRWCHDLIELTMSCHNFASFSSSTELLEAGFEAHYHHHKHESWGVTPHDGLKLHLPGAGIHPLSRMDLTTFPLFCHRATTSYCVKSFWWLDFGQRFFSSASLLFTSREAAWSREGVGWHCSAFFFILRSYLWSILASCWTCILGFILGI